MSNAVIDPDIDAIEAKQKLEEDVETLQTANDQLAESYERLHRDYGEVIRQRDQVIDEREALRRQLHCERRALRALLIAAWQESGDA